MIKKCHKLQSDSNSAKEKYYQQSSTEKPFQTFIESLHIFTQLSTKYPSPKGPLDIIENGNKNICGNSQSQQTKIKITSNFSVIKPSLPLPIYQGQAFMMVVRGSSLRSLITCCCFFINSKPFGVAL